MGADATLNSVVDWDDEMDESEGDGEKGDETDDPGVRDSIVFATLADDSDNNDAAKISFTITATSSNSAA